MDFLLCAPKPTDVLLNSFGHVQHVNVPWKQHQIHHGDFNTSASGLFSRKWVTVGWRDICLLNNTRWMEGSVINIVSDGRSKVCQKWHTLCPLKRNPPHSPTRWTVDAGGWMNQRAELNPLWDAGYRVGRVVSVCCTAVAPGAGGSGCVVCVVTVCRLCRCWQVVFGIHCETFLTLHGSMFPALKRPASAERST